MSTEDAPDPAVQIARTALQSDGWISADSGHARAVVKALFRNRWLHDPAEVDRLRKVETAAQSYVMSGLCGDIAEHQRAALHALIDVVRTDR